MPEDPELFKVLSEISMIAHLADTEFSRMLPSGMTPAQFGVLNRLVRLRLRETVTELANAFQVAQPTMTSTVRRLAEKSLVTLQQDVTDRRIRYVIITAAGEQVRDDAIATIGPLIQEFATSAPDIDSNALMHTLMRLRTFLDQRRSAL